MREPREPDVDSVPSLLSNSIGRVFKPFEAGMPGFVLSALRCRVSRPTSRALSLRLLCLCAVTQLFLTTGFSAPAQAADVKVWTWGANSSGQLGNDIGNNDVAPHPFPAPLNDLDGVVAVAAGGVHSLALKTDGTVWAWGNNQNGQLGLGTRDNDSHPVPVQVPGLINVTAISAGNHHSLALKDGKVWAWGLNDFKQLGDSTVTLRATPMAVPQLENVTAISAGNRHNLALKAGGTVWAWGRNDAGQLGVGTIDSLDRAPQATPVQVHDLNDIVVVAAGSKHNLALRNGDGAVLSWGSNEFGQVGNGSSLPQSTPVQLHLYQSRAELRDVISIAAAEEHSLAVMNTGLVWAWGHNNFGQLGSGAAGGIQRTPGAIFFTDAKAVSAVGAHSLALKSNGTLWSWGRNERGELGNGTVANSPTPAPVVGLTLQGAPDLRTTTAISAGGAHNLIIVSTSDPPFHVSLDRCRLRDWVCRAEPKLSPGLIGLQCDVRNCLVIDPIPKNCQLGFKCPGCTDSGKCPPVYNVFLEGLGDVWRVGLFDTMGRPAEHQRSEIRNGVVLSFRPSKESYIDGQIGDYMLVFEMGPKGKPGVRYNVRTRLETGDRSYEPPKDDRPDTRKR